MCLSYNVEAVLSGMFFLHDKAVLNLRPMLVLYGKAMLCSVLVLYGKEGINTFACPAW